MGKKGLYSISVVSSLLDVHPQTIRCYERKGLIKPTRTEGNTRLFSDEDLEKIKMILRLSNDLGVNLAGIEVIFNMRDKIQQMEREMIELLRKISQDYQDSLQKKDAENALVPISEARMRIKRFTEMDMFDDFKNAEKDGPKK